jgi:hypothetical protein
MTATITPGSDADLLIGALRLHAPTPHIDAGVAYAQSLGWDSLDRLMSLVLSRAMYSDEQLAQCEADRRWYPVEPGEAEAMIAPTDESDDE